MYFQTNPIGTSRGAVSNFNNLSEPQNSNFCSGSRNQKPSDRRVYHFKNDPQPKLILSLKGILLNANVGSKKLIKNGLFSRLTSGQLCYGSRKLNSLVDSILIDLKTGRSQSKRLLKRTPDDRWITLEFHLIKHQKKDEILVKINEGSLASNEALDALSVAFNFTLTELEVVRHMTNAACPKEIGNMMGISVNTVRSHLRAIYSKTGARGYNRALKLILELQM